MDFLVSAKGSDILAWRASSEFAVAYRQSLLARLEFCRSDEAEALLGGAGQNLDDLIAANEAFCTRSTDLLGEVSVSAEPPRLRELTALFYTGLYDHFGIHHSAPAFYEYGTLFLEALAASIVRSAQAAAGISEQQLPPVMLLALGAAGRQEFSPFCPLQLMLVHGEVGAEEQEAFSQLGNRIHEGFEACGLQVDGAVTPRSPQWRGSVAEWRQRLMQGLDQGGANELNDLFRLADQSVLWCSAGFDPEFTRLCRSALQERRSAMAFQVTRVLNLPHGIGILGGLRTVKKSPYRGLFALNEHALEPFSAAIGVLALLKRLETPSTPRRIREILWRRELNVDMAERLLQAWHSLHELLLARERDLQPDWSSEAPFYLNVGELPAGDESSLRASLETVATIQRQVGQVFSGMEE